MDVFSAELPSRREERNLNHVEVSRPSEVGHRVLRQPRATEIAVSMFAFYGRVSTEDQQDRASSRNWQLTRSQSLIQPHEGQIVQEFFDIGLSRSLPWKRRPAASALLEAFKRPDRGFTAVVIGEPARAFYGNHDLVMSLYGGMSKGERTRVKIRVRTAMAAQAATEGRFLGGRPPYGYRLVDAGPHPNPGKAATGQRLHRLEPDPITAPIVRRIFAEHLAGKGLYALSEGLTRDRIVCPSAADPGRNRHRSGIAWSKSAIRAILANPRYMSSVSAIIASSAPAANARTERVSDPAGGHGNQGGLPDLPVHPPRSGRHRSGHLVGGTGVAHPKPRPARRHLSTLCSWPSTRSCPTTSRPGHDRRAGPTGAGRCWLPWVCLRSCRVCARLSGARTTIRSAAGPDQDLHDRQEHDHEQQRPDQP